MAGKINSVGTKTLGQVATHMMIAGQLAKSRGVIEKKGVMVGRHKRLGTNQQMAAKVGNRGSKPPNQRPTFKQAAAAALAAHRSMHGKRGKKQVIPPHAKASHTPAPGRGQNKGQMQGGVD